MDISSFRDINIFLFRLNTTKTVCEIADSNIPYMDLTYCIQSTMHYRINGEDVILNPGDAIVFPPKSRRERLFSDHSCCYASFNAFLPDDFPLPFSGHIPGCVSTSTLSILDAFRQDFTSASFCKTEKCVSLFSYLLNQIEYVVFDKENPHIKNIKQYIQNNISSHITLKDIAHSVHLAPEYCSALFKKNTGNNIFSYITEQRIEHAIALILTTYTPLKEISEICGFDDYSYFSHTFKKVTGMTAMEYRKIRR